MIREGDFAGLDLDTAFARETDGGYPLHDGLPAGVGGVYRILPS